MKQIDIHIDGRISIDYRNSGWFVRQEQHRTAVYRTVKKASQVLRYTENGCLKPVDGLVDTLEVVEMPSSRYSLACDKPDSGNPGRKAFEQDLMTVMGQYESH